MKNYFYLFAILLFSLLLLNDSTIANTPDGITITKSSRGYVIDFALPTFQLNEKSVEGENYYELTVHGYGVNPDVGLPALPLISFNIFIAYSESQPEFSISNINTEEKILSNKIFPFQMPWEKSQPLDERPFTINREYYNASGNIEQPFIKISEPFIIAGVKGVIVTIYPFRYSPKDNKLVIINNASVEIILNNPVQPVSDKSEVFNQFFENIFVNYEFSAVRSLMKYLIITAPAYESAMSQFVNHKNGHGFEVEMFSTSITGTTNTAIKTFIQSRYNNPSTKPEFILLVGDVVNIPAWTGQGEGTPTTDLNYAQLEGGDYFADAFIGRFSVSNTTELQNAINKTIFMESYIATLQKKNIYMASTDNWQISEGTHNYVIDNYFNPAGYTNLKLYTHTYGATTQQLINALNDNQVFAIYSGHGSEYSWADGPVLNQQQVRDLTNTWYPFVYSFACITGSYHLSECFGETWLRTDNGASAFYGSSVNSYWDEDDILEKKIFQAMFEDDLTRITPMFDIGKIYLVNHYGGGITPGSTMLRYVEMYNLMGDPSIPVKRQIPPDTTPPDPVTDLAVVDLTSNSIMLNWTAPYDSTFGGVNAYDIRYSTSLITSENFETANQCMFDGQSDSAGTSKSYEICELAFNTQYYFAMKAMDMWGNKSLISNVVNGTTYDAPLCTITPAALHFLMEPDSTAADSITISNITSFPSTLDYTIELMNNTFPDNVMVRLTGVNELLRSHNNGTKDFPEIMNGMSFKGSGGPDLFGYRWKDSNEPNGPAYEWYDIRTIPGSVQITNWTGTLDDGYTGAIPMGFEFDFYGIPYSNVYVTTNGFLSLTALTSSYYTNEVIPDAGAPNNIICPFWDDLDGRTQGTVHYLQEVGRFILQYTNWQRYSGTGSLTFQIVLQSNNRILFYYNNLVGTLNSATVGIENNNGTDGLQIVFDAGYLENNLAVLIAADPDWLALNHFEGTLYNGNSAEIIMDVNTNDLELGDYSMDIVITTNDPVNQELIIPVTLTVTDVVPVELVSFTAEDVLNDVILKWQTVTENNNRGFEVERSQKSGVRSQNEWARISFIEGKGTSTEKTDYTYKDKFIKPGNYVYRLKQIDFDGTVTYSSEIEIEVSGPKDFTLYQNYPNPFNPSTTIKFTLPVNTNLIIAVYNLLGEKVAEVFNGELEAGYHEVEFNAVNIPSGVYFYRFESELFNAVKKMVIMK